LFGWRCKDREGEKKKKKRGSHTSPAKDEKKNRGSANQLGRSLVLSVASAVNQAFRGRIFCNSPQNYMEGG